MPCSLAPPLLPLPLNLSLVAPQFCSTCQRECIPIRSESRCLCGHRHKEHQQGQAAGAWRCVGVSDFDGRARRMYVWHALAHPASPSTLLPSSVCSCGSKGCTCPGFFYIVAEGAWVLRCRCKHKVGWQPPTGVEKTRLSPAVRRPRAMCTPSWRCFSNAAARHSPCRTLMSRST